MDTNDLKKLILKSAGDRTKLIDSLLAKLTKTVAGAQKSLLQRFINDWVSTLDTDEATGNIKNTARNKRLLNNVDKVFNQYVKTDGIEIAKTMLDGVKQVLDFNGTYFKNFNTHAELIPIKAQALELVKSWLGLKGNGWLEGNGYLAKTISNSQMLGEMKNFALRSIVGQQGYQSTLTAAREMIAGNPEQLGIFEKYSRNFVYDTYSQVDRATAGVYAQKLNLNYAIYEGGLIKTSRPFCRKRNSKVFTREEIAAFDPKTAIPPNYNPFNDLGGYGCRHHLNWVSEPVAFALRPELKQSE